ncbi:hypothetical protein LZ012_16935 [Dechloromonas sp. XY25]|uniref:Uncharacterized protein n=1 Tax=Dechloromonas hankyongensis TaxID=2908002 RepID=A0ABS9K689_9RHOO|nr:hypothetical protein [Dechloromonas hankyongensis]MCG2578686.1 hypothetical protein [Dechloromonas hankyongensis]
MHEETGTFEEQVAQIADRGLANADCVALRLVADRLWRSRHIPDLRQVPPELRADAGYLIERLTRFNNLDQGREIEILAALAPWQDESEHQSPASCRDPLAQEWGASSALSSRQLIALWP